MASPKRIALMGPPLRLFSLVAQICCDFEYKGESQSLVVKSIGKTDTPTMLLGENSADVLSLLDSYVDDFVDEYTTPGSGWPDKLRNSVGQCCSLHSALGNLGDVISQALNAAMSEEDEDEEDTTEAPAAAAAATDVEPTASDEETKEADEPPAPLVNVKFYYDIDLLQDDGSLDLFTGNVAQAISNVVTKGVEACCGEPACEHEGQHEAATEQPAATEDVGEPAIVG